MYTKEDFFRDYPPKDETELLPWKDQLQYAFQQGVKQNRVELASKMLSKRLVIPLVAKITGLSESRIQDLKPDMCTKEDVSRDYPPTDRTFLFPWEKDLQKAFQQGVKQNRTELATKMLSEGLVIPLIAKITGLSESQINALKPE
jgi:predicted transposase YdaD